ncbi:MAG: hypothetical protein P8X74_17165 [Reinekea sp.]
MNMNYDEYRESVCEDIKECIDNLGVQPILFFGSGMSRRYIGTPSWEALLQEISNRCPNIKMGFAYYQQKYSNCIEIGTEFAELVREWAWEN